MQNNQKFEPQPDKTISLDINLKHETDILEWLKQQPDIPKYIKQLIQRDMKIHHFSATEEKIPTYVDNFFDEDILIPNIKGAAYFILLYEHLEDIIIETVREFYDLPSVIDGNLYSVLDDEFIDVLQEKIKKGETNPYISYETMLKDALAAQKKYKNAISIGKNGNDGKRLRGSLNWLKERNVFTQTEIEDFLSIRQRRNTIVHEFFESIGSGLTVNDAQMIHNLLDYHAHISNWYFRNHDMELIDYQFSDDVDLTQVVSMNDAILSSIYRILFLNEGEQFKQVLFQAKSKQTEKNGKPD